MDGQPDKVYVAVGNDVEDGFATLEWALKYWSSHPISIVILYATNNSSKDLVRTPFGKLPSSSVSDETLEVFRKYEEGKIDKLLSKYIDFCGKVEAEILKLEKYDEPIHRHVLELISGLRITKLVMGMTFLKSSSRSKSAISRSFYIYRQKPEFCKLFIVCGGKLVFLREENDEGVMEDDQGVMVAKMREKASFKDWLGKMFTERSPRSASSTSANSPDDSQNQWEKYVQEIESYYQQLLSSNLDEEDCEMENDHVLQTSPSEPDMPENTNFIMSNVDNIEAVRIKIDETHGAIQLKRKEAKANVERHARAEWAICLCNGRTEELEALINKEIMSRIDLKKDLDAAKEHVYEVLSDVTESKSRLGSIVELQSELSKKLRISALAKSRAETELEKAVTERAETVRKIEAFRRQRDVVQRRIEFCREKDAIGLAMRLSDLSCIYKEFTPEEIKLATDDFSERLRLKSGGDWTNVYRGCINHKTVAIKLLNSVNGLSREAFQDKVRHLSNIRHPHIVALIGFCSELKCVIFEYMHNGSLRDILFSSHRNSRTRKRALHWQARIRIAAELCSGLGFLHLAEPRPIVHGNLNPSNILLDRNLVAKIHCFRIAPCCDESDVRSDVHALGVLMLQLLTGRNWAGLVEEAMVRDSAALIGVLDERAGKWPLDLAKEFAGIAMRCLSTNQEADTELRMSIAMKELDELRKKADDREASGGCEVTIEGGVDMEDSIDVPSVFLCPIFKEVMKNPHVAADGSSYELEAIEEWLQTGHDTSPMTNLRLNHKTLTPNHALRSLIQDWQNKRLTLPP